MISGALLVMVLALATLGWFRPRVFLAVGLTAMLIAPTLGRATGLSGTDSVDEAIVVTSLFLLCCRRLLTVGQIRYLPGTLPFGAFFLCGIVSAILRDVDPGVYLSGGAVAIKGVIYAFAVAQLDWRPSDIAKAAKIGAVALSSIIFFGLCNVVAPGAWLSLVGRPAVPEFTYGIPAVVGPFVHPSVYGRVAALGALAVLLYRAKVGKRPITLILLLAASGAAILGFRKKTLAGGAAIWLYLTGRLHKAGAAVAMVVIGMPLTLILWSPVSNVAQETYADYFERRAARTTLTVDSISVANDYFPLGAGFGRFGSSVASDTYSPEYTKRGYQAVYGLGSSVESGRYLRDTQWPAIIGETGYVGATAFLLGLGMMAQTLVRRVSRTASTLESWITATALAWLALILVESTAAPVFTSSPTYPLLFGALAMALAATPTDTDPRGATFRPGRSSTRAGAERRQPLIARSASSAGGIRSK